MRSLMSAVAVLAAGTLMACNGGQPRVYKIAIDTSPLKNLPATCYSAGNAPSNTPTESGLVETQDWELFDGAQKQYLSLGTRTIGMGEAPSVQIGPGSTFDTIEGGPKTFTGEYKTVSNPGGGTNEVTQDKVVTVTFDDTPGNTASGTIDVKSTVTCTQTPCSPSCEVTMTFNGRKIEGTPIQLTNGF